MRLSAQTKWKLSIDRLLGLTYVSTGVERGLLNKSPGSPKSKQENPQARRQCHGQRQNDQADFTTVSCEVNVSIDPQDSHGETAVLQIEMRAAPRYPIMQRCSVHPAKVSASKAWRCIAYNISLTGIGVVLPVKLPEGTVLTIVAKNLPQAGSLQARIVQTRPVENSWYAGCELLKRLSDSDLQVWRNGPLDWLEENKK